MSMFGGLMHLAAPLMKGAKALSKIPGVGMIPGVGNALSALGTAASLYDLGTKFLPGGSPSGGGGAGGAGTGLPALPMAAMTAGAAPATAQLPMPMPGGGSSLKTVHLSPMMPQDKATLDAWIAAGLIIPFNQLHTAYRAPKGFRVCHVNGMTIAVRSDVARKMHLVKPTHKPPISVGEYHSLKRAHRTIKKVHKIHGLIKYVADHTTTGGKVKIAHHHHKKGAHK